MSRWEGVNCDLVYVSIDGSQKELGRHKGIRSLFAPPKPANDLTETYNSEHY